MVFGGPPKFSMANPWICTIIIMNLKSHDKIAYNSINYPIDLKKVPDLNFAVPVGSYDFRITAPMASSHLTVYRSIQVGLQSEKDIGLSHSTWNLPLYKSALTLR